VFLQSGIPIILRFRQQLLIPTEGRRRRRRRRRKGSDRH